MGKFNYFSYKEKRFDKLSLESQTELVFDLINAFTLAKTPADSALLIQDLLTEKEVRNLAKRLRIAKLLLSNKTNREISKEIKCSFATVSKVRIWLENAGEGLRKTINKLPRRRGVYKLKKTPGVGYGLPQILLYFASAHLEAKERQQLERFLSDLRWKSSIDRDLREETSAEFQTLSKKKNK